MCRRYCESSSFLLLLSSGFVVGNENERDENEHDENERDEVFNVDATGARHGNLTGANREDLLSDVATFSNIVISAIPSSGRGW